MQGFNRAQESVHYNVHIAVLKALAKNSESSMVRFVIDKNDDLHAGDANHITHADLYDNIGNDSSIHGLVVFSTNSSSPKYNFDSWNASDPGPGKPRPNHSILDRFEKHGISRNTYMIN